MKLSSLALATFLVSSLAHADLALQFQENCKTESIKKIIGSTGSCRIVVAPKPAKIEGSCSGKFMGALNCTAKFSHETKTAHLTCGDVSEPALDLEMVAEFSQYQVLTLVTSKRGTTLIKNDPVLYRQVSNRLLEINLNESTGGDSTPSFFLFTESGKSELTEVQCK